MGGWVCRWTRAETGDDDGVSFCVLSFDVVVVVVA